MPTVTCPVCETRPPHLDTRCPSPREPNPNCKWVSLGVPKATMNKWVTRGKVRVRGELQVREYLLRNVVMRLAMSRQRREFTKVNHSVTRGI